MAEKQAFVDPNLEEDKDTVQADVPAKKLLRVSKSGAVVLRICIAVLGFLACAVLALLLNLPALLVVGLVVGLLLFLSVHVVMEWERAVIMRNGRFHHVSGPGLVFVFPFVEFVAAIVDMRVRTTTIRAERTLTSDLLPVDVDAVLFWVVWDAKNACLEVNDVANAVLYAAQTTLRDAIGGMNVSEMGMRRRQLDEEIYNSLSKKTTDWGVNVLGVEIRDIEIPEELQESMAAEARAEREFNARMLMAEAEEQVADMYVDAARKYKEEDAALQLRAMNLAAESVKEKGGYVVMPSALAESLDGLGKLSEK